MQTLKRIALVVLAVCAIALLNRAPVEVRAQEEATDLAGLEYRMKQHLRDAVLEGEKVLGESIDPRLVTVVDLASGWRYSIDRGLRWVAAEARERIAPAEPLEQPEAGTEATGTLCCYPSDEYGTLGYQYGPFRRVVSYQGYAHGDGVFTTPTSANMCGVDQGTESGYMYFGFRSYAPDPRLAVWCTGVRISRRGWSPDRLRTSVGTLSTAGPAVCGKRTRLAVGYGHGIASTFTKMRTGPSLASPRHGRPHGDVDSARRHYSMVHLV